MAQSELFKKILKASQVEEASAFNTSKILNEQINVKTDLPALNLALSGELDRGLSSGVLTIAGPSKHFKSLLGLLVCKAYLDAYPDAVMIFYDSEFGAPASYFQSVGIDTKRVVHIPVSTMEQIKNSMVNILDDLKRGDKAIVFFDSYGNTASRKELDDAKSGSDKADMTRAKSGKSLFRMITSKLKILDIPMVIINHIYSEIGMFPKDILAGGCVVAGTKVKMFDGTLKNIEDITPNELVLNENNTPSLVTHTWNPDTLEDGTPECYEVEFQDGSKITCSENHRFLTQSGWKYVTDITEEDNLLVVNDKNSSMKIKKITKVGSQPVYDLTVAETNSYVTENGVVSHNTGILYASNDVWFIGRQKEREGTEVSGYNFIIKIEKSRFVVEGKKIPITVSNGKGIFKYSALLPLALLGGFIVKPSNGWYQLAGEEQKVREKETGPLLDKLLEMKEFKDFVRGHYQLAQSKLISEDTPDDISEDISEE